MRIILVRHGETVDDLTDCYGGYADFDLTDNGRKTAADLANKLKNKKIEKIISSPLKRARQTAEEIDKVKKCGVDISEFLFERNSYGIMSGSNKEECKQIFGWLLKNYKDKIGDYYSEECFIGAEPVKDFDVRIKNAMQDIANKYAKYNTIAIVTHGNVTKSIYKNLLKIKNKIDLDLLAVTTIVYEKGNYKLISNEGVKIKEEK